MSASTLRTQTASAPSHTTVSTTAAADWTAWTCRVRVVVIDNAALYGAREVLTERMAAVDLACSRFRFPR